MSDNKVLTGTVVWFDPAKGYGFIKPEEGDKDLFVQYSHVQMEGFKTLKPEQKVEFKIGSNHRGDIATEVKVLSTPE